MFRKAECKHTSVIFCFYICLQIHCLPSLSCSAFQDVKLYHSGSLALAPSCAQPIRSIVWWLKDGRGERLRTPPYPPLPGPPRVSRALVLNSSLCSSVPGDGTTFRLFLSPGSFFIHHGFLEPVHSSANGPYLDSQMRQYLRRLTLVFSLCLPPTLHQNTSVRRAVHRGPGQELGKLRVALRPWPRWALNAFFHFTTPGPLDHDLLQILSLKVSQIHPASLQCLCPTLVAARIISCLHFCKNPSRLPSL